MDVLYQLSYPGDGPNCSVRPVAPRDVLKLALPLGALAIIAVGAVMLAAGESVAGWALVGFGVIDLLSVPLVLKMVKTGPTASEPGPEPLETAVPTEPPDPAADPSYNPYARED